MSENSEEKVQLETTQLVEIANNLQSSNRQLSLMVKDLGDKVAAKEIENSRLKALVTQFANPSQEPNVEEE
jgi:hypothetical protein|tara:strand:+ start:942 stop:1154 length:213 start_codon:yes stop_codon:yes gene_type:complete